MIIFTRTRRYRRNELLQRGETCRQARGRRTIIQVSREGRHLQLNTATAFNEIIYDVRKLNCIGISMQWLIYLHRRTVDHCPEGE